MQWLPRLLYPEQYDNDLHKTVAGYFKTFYGYDLSESEFNEIAATRSPSIGTASIARPRKAPARAGFLL